MNDTRTGAAGAGTSTMSTPSRRVRSERTGRPVTVEQRLIRRTSRRIAAATAIVFAISIVVLAALASAIVIRTQYTDAQRMLRQAIADEDAITDPPSGILLYQIDNGQVRASPQLVHPPLDSAAVAAVMAGGEARSSNKHAMGREFLVRTDRRGTAVVQAALDLSDQNDERQRLMKSLGAASLVGFGLALVVGWLIARHAIAPLGMAIARQQRFVADASHELRTPLTQLHTRAQLLQRSLRDVPDRPQLTEDADKLVRYSRQLGEIVQELLMSAQLRAEPHTFGPVDLAGIANDVVDADQGRARERGVRLELVADAGPHVVRGEATALRRVLTALVDNALGHTRPDGHIGVELSGGAESGHVVCVVRDDGVGFDAADSELLFERFARGARSDGRRFGLGLALVREVVQAHGGEVTAAAEPDSGAAFTVRLPAWTR